MPVICSTTLIVNEWFSHLMAVIVEVSDTRMLTIDLLPVKQKQLYYDERTTGE